MKILDRVKLYCEREGVSQQEFAQRVGIQATTLSRLLNGRIKHLSVLKIDAYLEEAEKQQCVASDYQDTPHAPEA